MPDLWVVQIACRESGKERGAVQETDVVRGNYHQRLSSYPPQKYFNHYS